VLGCSGGVGRCRRGWVSVRSARGPSTRSSAWPNSPCAYATHVPARPRCQLWLLRARFSVELEDILHLLRPEEVGLLEPGRTGVGRAHPRPRRRPRLSPFPLTAARCHPGRRGPGGAVQVEPAREPAAQPACRVAEIGSPGSVLAAARQLIDARTTSFAPVLRVGGRRNGPIVSYISGLISVRCLFCSGFIDNSHPCFMNGPICRPNKSPSRVASTGNRSTS
jgi:hypothetical protein